MFYVVNNHLNNLYVLSNKAVGPGKNQKLINVGPTSIPEARVVTWIMPDIWLKLNFSCSLKMKLVTNILGYFLAQEKIFKIVRENILKCSRPISSSHNKKSLLTTRNVRLNRGHYATKYVPVSNQLQILKHFVFNNLILENLGVKTLYYRGVSNVKA